MPRDILQRVGVMDLSDAVFTAHFPSDEESWERARVRLAFDELFLLQMSVMLRKKGWQEDAKGTPIKTDGVVVSNFLKLLPFP